MTTLPHHLEHDACLSAQSLEVAPRQREILQTLNELFDGLCSTPPAETTFADVSVDSQGCSHGSKSPAAY